MRYAMTMAVCLCGVAAMCLGSMALVWKVMPFYGVGRDGDLGIGLTFFAILGVPGAYTFRGTVRSLLTFRRRQDPAPVQSAQPPATASPT